MIQRNAVDADEVAKVAADDATDKLQATSDALINVEKVEADNGIKPVQQYHLQMLRRLQLLQILYMMRQHSIMRKQN